MNLKNNSKFITYTYEENSTTMVYECLPGLKNICIFLQQKYVPKLIFFLIEILKSCIFLWNLVHLYVYM